MKEKILKYKYLIYPIIVLLAVVILSLLNLNGSSIGRYSQVLFPTQEDKNVIFGFPRAIRSDEFLFSTPILISQDINNEPIINTDIGEGTNIGYLHNMPTRDIFTIFEPASWSFLFTDNTDLSFAIYWWIRIAIMLLGTYLLLLELTNQNLFLSVSGSLLFLVTPFIQWWLSADPMAPIGLISFGIFFFIKLLKCKGIIVHIIYSIALAYTIIAFGLILYPAFQVPLGIIAICIAIGVLINQRKIYLTNKKDFILFVSSLIFSLGIVIIFATLFYLSFKDVISIVMNTSYPGARFISAGQGNIYTLLSSGFYDILMQMDSNGAPYANQCEASNFFMIFIPLLIWLPYKNILLAKNKKRIDILGISIATPLLLFSLWSLLPLPDFISKYTALYMVPPQRLLIGIGFLNYLLILHMLSCNIYKFDKKKLLDKILLIFLILITAILSFLTGKYLYSLNPTFFVHPTIVSPIIKISLVTFLVPTLLFLLLKQFKVLFIAIFLLFGLVSTIYINPLYKGVDILTETDLANYITDLSTKDDSKWIIYGDHHYAQYALANNANLINGIHSYPQFRIWSILDPQKKYYDIYNRYAHIIFSDYEEGEDTIVQIQNDALQVNISPCSHQLKNLGVKYILSTIDFKDNSCLIKEKDFGNATVYLLR